MDKNVTNRCFLEVFSSEPSNLHGWNTCLKLLSDSEHGKFYPFSRAKPVIQQKRKSRTRDDKENHILPHLWNRIYHPKWSSKRNFVPRMSNRTNTSFMSFSCHAFMKYILPPTVQQAQTSNRQRIETKYVISKFVNTCLKIHWKLNKSILHADLLNKRKHKSVTKYSSR